MMRTPYTAPKDGFTLVEILVYLAILLIVATGAITFLLSLSDLIDQYQIETALYRSSTNVMERVLVELRQGDEFDAAGTVLADAAAGQLSIRNNGVTTVFTKVGDELHLTEGGVDQGNMVSDAVSVTGFTVYEYDTAAGTLVRVHLELTGTIESVTKSIDVYGGAVIRGAL